MGCCCSKDDRIVPNNPSQDSSGDPLLHSPVDPPDSEDLGHDVTTEESRVAEIILEAGNDSHLVGIVYSPASETHKCAYCDNPNGDLYDYFHVFSSMSCTLFEEFFEAGWWRTGKVVFRPRFEVVCCPGYATRLPVDDYTLTKKHRRVIRKWGEFLKNGDLQWEERELASNCENVLVHVDNETTTDAVQPTKMNTKAKPKKVVRSGVGPDPSKPPCKKSKERKAKRFKSSNKPQEASSEKEPNSILSLTQFINQEIPSAMTGLKHRFDVMLVPCSLTNPVLISTAQRAYHLYEKLQNVVHTGKSRFESLEQFLQGFYDSCLGNDRNQGTPQGSFHLQYYLDRELVMYSIVDITPSYFVSVYFIYDPDLRFISPGIFTCLYEMSLVQKLKQTMPNMKYYGLGYYNPFDDKASYKRQFKPQQVLCNETNVFVSLESATPKIQAKKYCRLVDESVPEKEGRSASIDMISVLKKSVPLGQFRALPEEEVERYKQSLTQFVCEAGSKAALQCNVDLFDNYKKD